MGGNRLYLEEMINNGYLYNIKTVVLNVYLCYQHR